MIKRSLFFCLIFCTVYTLILLTKPDVAVTTNQWQGNKIKAENFLYNTTDTLNNIIIGTSLSSCIIMDSIQNFYNLAFSGLSIYEGLDIVMQRKKLPDNVYIETNYPLKKSNSVFFQDFNNNFLRTLKKYFITVREGRQPIAILGVVAQKTLKIIFSDKEKQEDLSDNISNKKQNILKKMLEIKIKEYSMTSDSVLLKQQYSLLTKKVNYLKNKGVKIIFFEMPVHCQLVNAPLALQTRNYHKINYPETEYNYIKMPDCSQYRTGDGVHITYNEAINYTSYFKKESLKFTSAPIANENIMNNQDTNE